MKFMLLQNYEGGENCDVPMSQWTPEEIRAHIDYQLNLNRELAERGELIDAQGLAGPELAKFVTYDGKGAPVVTDGPFPESKELLDASMLSRAFLRVGCRGGGRGVA
jgi:hypothetical protein